MKFLIQDTTVPLMAGWALLSSKTSWQGASTADIQPIIMSCHFLQGTIMLKLETIADPLTTSEIDHSAKWSSFHCFSCWLLPSQRRPLYSVQICTVHPIFLAYVNNFSSFSKASPASPPWVKTCLNLVLVQLWVKPWPPTTPGGPWPWQPWYFEDFNL